MSLGTWDKPRDPGALPLIALGAMNFGRRTPAAEADRIVDRAFERGVRVFDTANAYGNGESERILGRAIRARRGEVILATKVGFAQVDRRPEGLSPARIRQALAQSLERLGTDYVDLYYLHVPDHDTPIEASLEAIREALEAGSIRAFGVSNYASWQLLELMMACDRMEMPRPVVSQQLYNLLIRQLDLEYFRFARRYPIHTTVYNPLAGGLLTGRYHPGDDIAKGSRFDANRLYQGRYWSPRMLAHAADYQAIAATVGCSLVELAYRWLASVRGVDSILVGPGSVAHLDQALDAVAQPLAGEVQKSIDAVYRAFVGTETSYAR
jgi:aryl-alcohol dehydrogenase-like predicted oxidoreductase